MEGNTPKCFEGGSAMSKRKEKRIHIAWICAIGFVLLVASLFLTPLGDDWGYSTTPQIDREFVMSSRPFDLLFGMLLGEMPFAFPILNHVIIVVAHCVSCVAFYLIATNVLKFKTTHSFIFSILFAISSTCYATVFSIDSLNQSLSLCFGVVGIYAYMRFPKNAVVRTILYLVASILSAFSKESGIVFFFIIPAFDLYFNGFKNTWKQALVNYVLGGAFCLFFVQLVRASKNMGSFTIINTLKNTIIHLGFSTLQFDTVSFFGYGEIVMPILTAVLSLPLLLLMFKSIIQRLAKKDFGVLFLGFLAVLSTFPQNLMVGIQEMNSYPTVFFVMLFFAYLSKDWNKKTLYIVLAPYVASALICGGIKYGALYKLSVQSQEVLSNIEAQTSHVSPKKVKVYPINVFNEDSYGVFVLSPSGTIGYGHGVKSIYGYDVQLEIECYHNRTDKTVIGSTHSTLINVPDEEFLKLLQEHAQEEVDNKEFDLCLILHPDGNVIVVD